MRWRIKANYGSLYYKGETHTSTPTAPSKSFVGPASLGKGAFKDKLEQVGRTKVEKIPSIVGLKTVHRGSGKYNVINEKTGKTINDTLLNRQDAFDLVKLYRGKDMEEEDKG